MDRLNSALLIGLAVSLTFYHLLQSLVRYLTRAKFARDHKCQPEPRIPTFDPFFGLDGVIRTGKLFKERRVLKGLRIRHEELGNTYASFTGGGKNIFTCDVENIKSIWGTDFQKYGVEPTRRAAFEPSFGRGVSSSDGAFWEHSRAMIRPPLGRSNFANLPAFEMHLKNMLDHIPTDGSTIDLHPLFINLFLDSSSQILFGKSLSILSSSTPKESSEFVWAFQTAQQTVLWRMILNKLRIFHISAKARKANRIIKEWAEPYVEEALSYRAKYIASAKPIASEEEPTLQEPQILMHEVAKHTGDRNVIRSQILQVLIGSYDTISATLSNVFFLLSRHPGEYKKLREEVLAIPTDTPLTFSLLRSLKYTRWVINETLRLYPIGPFHARTALVSTILPTGGGPSGTSPIAVFPGDTVTGTFHALHRRTDIWGTDADEFNPSRWNIARPTWEYLPFSGGPRTCPGQQLALTQATYVLVRMGRMFEKIENRDEREWTEDLKMTCANLNGCVVGLVPAVEGWRREG